VGCTRRTHRTAVGSGGVAASWRVRGLRAEPIAAQLSRISDMETGAHSTQRGTAGYPANLLVAEVPSRDTSAGLCTQEIILMRLAEF
jgi:hypothetical protein